MNPSPAQSNQATTFILETPMQQNDNASNPADIDVKALLFGDPMLLENLHLSGDNADAKVFNWLMQQPFDFHQRNTLAYQSIFEAALSSQDWTKEERHRLLYFIIPIVAEHRTGLSGDFIQAQRSLAQGDHELELDLLMLEIKLAEGQPDFNPSGWENLAQEKDHFAPAFIYLYMRNKPEKALNCLWELDKKGWKMEPTLRWHFKNYVFIAAYHYLQDQRSSQVFIRWHHSLKTGWAKQLMKKTLKRPLFQSIRKRLAYVKSSIMSEDEQSRPLSQGLPPSDFSLPSGASLDAAINQDNYLEYLDKLVHFVEAMWYASQKIDPTFGEVFDDFLHALHTHKKTSARTRHHLQTAHGIAYDLGNAQFTGKYPKPISLISDERIQFRIRSGMNRENHCACLEDLLQEPEPEQRD